jgi:glycosyltransferase involved in cell wall biosynthesis
MRRAAVLAVPSVTSASGDTEGLPTVLVEGLATGLPAVGTRHAGIPEAIRDGESGYLVPERDSGALADRILELLTDSSGWSAMSKAARAVAEREYDLQAQTARLEDIYATVAAS